MQDEMVARELAEKERKRCVELNVEKYCLTQWVIRFAQSVVLIYVQVF